MILLSLGLSGINADSTQKRKKQAQHGADCRSTLMELVIYFGLLVTLKLDEHTGFHSGNGKFCVVFIASWSFRWFRVLYIQIV